MIFRGNSAADLGQGRDNLLKQVCGYIGGRLDLTGLFVIGGDFDTGVITRWDAYDAAGTRTRMGSFFRVQNGLIVEWMDRRWTEPARHAGEPEFAGLPGGEYRARGADRRGAAPELMSASRHRAPSWKDVNEHF